MSNIILVHGAWGGAWEFEETIKQLNNQGHHAIAIDLPGHGENDAPIPEVTMAAYVDHVVNAVNASDEKVVLVGHSLAGSIVAQAAEQIPEKIDRVVFVAAFLPSNGQSPIELMKSDEGGKLLPRIVFSKNQTSATIDESTIQEVLLHDIEDPDRVAELTPHFFMEQATEPFMAPARLTESRFGSVPKFYIRASLDKVMSLALQDRLITNWDVERVMTLDSSHFPLLSTPGSLADLISETATSMTSVEAG